MKNILSFIILAVLSSPAFSAQNLTCGVFEKTAASKPAYTTHIDLSKAYSAQDIWLNGKRTFTIENINGFINMGMGGPKDFLKTTLPLKLVKQLGNQSISLQNYNPLDGERHYHAVCYLTGDSTIGPWDR